MKEKRILSLVLMLLGTAFSAMAGDVTMKTEKSVGEPFVLAVNEGVTLTFIWGDGSSEVIQSTGLLQEVTVKDPSLTISGDKDITSLYLADNGLTELNVSGISSSLRRLFCPNNKLTRLSLSGCLELVSLDCQGNQLTSLNVPSTKMTDLNFADNHISTNGLGSGENLTSLICANNNITTISSIGSMPNLTSAFFQNNNVSSVNLSKSVELRNVIGFGNKISSFNAKPLVNIEYLWLGDNKLTSLDLSDATNLESLCVENNQLSELLTTSGSSATFKTIDLSDNQLFFNSFPPVYSVNDETVLIEGSVSPQAPYHLLDDQTVNKRSDSVRDHVARNAWSGAFQSELTLTDENGNELVQNTDYKYTAYRFTFLTAPHNGVTITVTSAAFPGAVLTTEPFNVLSDKTPGDVNEDGNVDINDVVAIINTMAGTAEWANADENTDGIVDINDVVAVINIMARK